MSCQQAGWAPTREGCGGTRWHACCGQWRVDRIGRGDRGHLGKAVPQLVIEGCAGSPATAVVIERQPPPGRLSLAPRPGLTQIVANTRSRSKGPVATGYETLIRSPRVHIPAGA